MPDRFPKVVSFDGMVVRCHPAILESMDRGWLTFVLIVALAVGSGCAAQTSPSPAVTAAASQKPIRPPRYGQGCQCPYDRAKDGSYCGARSAYSRAGGAKPACYTRA